VACAGTLDTLNKKIKMIRSLPKPPESELLEENMVLRPAVYFGVHQGDEYHEDEYRYSSTVLTS
jgi:hypothetical protein